MNKQAKILIVDDEEKNLKLLEAILAPLGYEVVKARDGMEALDAAKASSPDVVLLDVMMPGMDGFEVCRRLKLNGGYLPILMITSLNDRDSRLKGIESGADDFLSKPFDSTELKLKINNFLRTKYLYDKVEKNYREIKALDELKDSLTSFIVHDLRNPLTGIKGYLNLLSTSKNLNEQDFDDVNKAKRNVEMMIGMISNLLDTTKMENNEMEIAAEDCELEEIVSSAIRTVEHSLNAKTIHLFNKTNETGMRVKVQRDLIERVAQNLLSNAIRYTPEQGEIIIESEPAEETGFVVISVSDSGSGVPGEHQRKIFDKFATVETKQKRIRGSTGLGLAFCKLAVELHGGRIWVEDRNGGGSSFRFTLPVSGSD